MAEMPRENEMREDLLCLLQAQLGKRVLDQPGPCLPNQVGDGQQHSAVVRPRAEGTGLAQGRHTYPVLMSWEDIATRGTWPLRDEGFLNQYRTVLCDQARNPPVAGSTCHLVGRVGRTPEVSCQEKVPGLRPAIGEEGLP